MDCKAARASCPRQPHERLCSVQAGAHRRRADHQALRRRPLGAACGYAIYTAGSVACAARIVTQPLGAAPALPESRGLEKNFPPSRDGSCFSGEKPRALFLAWKTPRRPYHRAAEETRVVRDSPPQGTEKTLRQDTPWGKRLRWEHRLYGKSASWSPSVT